MNLFQMAEEARQKYDLDMASYRQAGFSQAQQGQVSTKKSSSGPTWRALQNRSWNGSFVDEVSS